MNGLCAFLIGKGVDMNFIGYHECGIKAESEMTDYLLISGFVLVFFYKVGSSRKSDLIDVFVNLIRCHSDTVIGDRYRLIFGTYDYVHFGLKSIGKRILSHHVKLF